MLLNIVLILVVMEDGLVPNERDGSYLMVSTVLILIVVEDGLVQSRLREMLRLSRLNPYCSGRWSRTHWSLVNYCWSTQS